jgi:hypothetical protein
MENLALYKDWLDNEEKIAPLILQLKPLLEIRHAIEAKDPRLGLMRDDRTVPGEVAPPQLSSAALLKLRPTTQLVGSHEPLKGDPSRSVPSMEDFERLIAKRKAKNKKTHERQKKKKNVEKMEDDPPPSDDKPT